LYQFAGGDEVSEINEVTIYTDGGAVGNPGPGGYGVVLIHGKHRRELSGGYRRTTNNRMEILAAIKGLEALKRHCRVTVYSDSQYVVNAMESGWAADWKAHGWMRNKKERAMNPDLWDRLLQLAGQHEVRFKWVRGHAGIKENERCDQLVRQATAGNNLQVDENYESDSHPAGKTGLF
jgi:ribonuclease HI